MTNSSSPFSNTHVFFVFFFVGILSMVMVSPFLIRLHLFSFDYFITLHCIGILLHVCLPACLPALLENALAQYIYIYISDKYLLTEPATQKWIDA
jgi:hypothetical protein